MQKSSPLRILYTCLWLIDKLQAKGRMTYDQLNQAWLVNNSTINKAGNYDLEKRTLSNYWKYLDQIFNIVVLCDRRTNEYYIEEHYDTKITDWLLSAFSISNTLSDGREMQNRILLEDIPSGQKFLTPIITAMKEGHPIEMTYQKFQEDSPYTAQGDPLCLKLVQQRWYVLVLDPDKDYYPLYALDRILDLKILSDQCFSLPRDFDATGLFTNSFGAFTSEPDECSMIKISVNDMQRKYWRTLPVHHSQKEEEIYADHSIFSLYLKITPDFENYLLSLGDQIEVLWPKELRTRIKEQHFNAALRYDDER